MTGEVKVNASKRALEILNMLTPAKPRQIKDALEDGAALAALGITDADQEAVKEAHAVIIEYIEDNDFNPIDKNLIDTLCTGIEQSIRRSCRQIPGAIESLNRCEQLRRSWLCGDINELEYTNKRKKELEGSGIKEAIEAVEYCEKARKFGISEKGALFLMMAESARKDFELYEDAVAHAPFKKGRKKGAISPATDYLKRVIKEHPDATAAKQADIVFANADTIGSPYELDDPYDSSKGIIEIGRKGTITKEQLIEKIYRARYSK